MKHLLIIAVGILGMLMARCQSTKVAERNYAYEAYCDSIYAADPDYYLDVLVEGDEYCTYIEEHGQWWEN